MAFDGCGLQEVHIPDGVEEFCALCSYSCTNLSRATFGESSSLKLIGNRAFLGSAVGGVCIPDGVEELCDAFFGCARIFRVLHLVSLLR